MNLADMQCFPIMHLHQFFLMTSRGPGRAHLVCPISAEVFLGVKENTS